MSLAKPCGCDRASVSTLGSPRLLPRSYHLALVLRVLDSGSQYSISRLALGVGGVAGKSRMSVVNPHRRSDQTRLLTAKLGETNFHAFSESRLRPERDELVMIVNGAKFCRQHLC
jgi:hypothetical protein